MRPIGLFYQTSHRPARYWQAAERLGFPRLWRALQPFQKSTRVHNLVGFYRALFPARGFSRSTPSGSFQRCCSRAVRVEPCICKRKSFIALVIARPMPKSSVRRTAPAGALTSGRGGAEQASGCQNPERQQPSTQKLGSVNRNSRELASAMDMIKACRPFPLSHLDKSFLKNCGGRCASLAVRARHRWPRPGGTKRRIRRIHSMGGFDGE